ncbi:MAG TPA: hypothetical protein VIN05_05515 [Roseovarius sp.]
MKAAKFVDARKALVIRQDAYGTTAADICCEAGIRGAAYFNCREMRAEIRPTDINRLCDPKDEGSWSKNIVADQAVDEKMLQGVLTRKQLVMFR